MQLNRTTNKTKREKGESVMRFYDFEAKDFEGNVVLDFPCNQFENQAPGSDDEIFSFCDSRFGITFPHFSKIDVNGEKALPLYKYLQKEKGFEGFDPEHPMTLFLESKLERLAPNYKNESDIKWNFTKFLIDRKGNVVARFEPTEAMLCEILYSREDVMVI